MTSQLIFSELVSFFSRPPDPKCEKNTYKSTNKNFWALTQCRINVDMTLIQSNVPAGCIPGW